MERPGALTGDEALDAARGRLAEAESRFDVVALVEIRHTLEAFCLLMEFLGPNWSFLVTDTVVEKPEKRRAARLPLRHAARSRAPSVPFPFRDGVGPGCFGPLLRTERLHAVPTFRAWAMTRANVGKLEARGVLRQLTRDGQLVDLRCEMPQCYCFRGRRYFEPRSTLSKWSPTADHHPRLKMHGGHLTPDNVRLAHRVCNQRDYLWRKRINVLLGKRMSLEEIAEKLNAEKVPAIHGTNRWTAAAVREAFVS